MGYGYVFSFVPVFTLVNGSTLRSPVFAFTKDKIEM